MSVFNAKYLSDEDIWKLLGQVEEEYENLAVLLAQPEVSTDPEKLPGLAKRLHELNNICLLASELKKIVRDVADLKIMLGLGKDQTGQTWSGKNLSPEEQELWLLYDEYNSMLNDKAGQLYRWLVDNGYMEVEQEDETDLAILKFIDYAGAEYAWRLGINIGLDVAESRRRLEKLLEKGLLERVEGKMLENYHREKSWTKHMNHTYYRISREGRLYVRRLRNAQK